MQLSKNKKYQYLFFLILIIYTIFNGGNSNLSIQINFILISFLFLYCLKDKNYNLHLKIFYSKNKTSITFYLLFLCYLIFQIIPMPTEFLKVFSPEKYNYLSKLNSDNMYVSISLFPSNSFFQIINFLTLFILILILKMIFYTERHKNRLYLFLSLLGFFSSVIAIVFYLKGNPDFFIFKNSYYKNSSTGFFINRTVFAIFLLFCLISSLELLRNLDVKLNKKNNDFFIKIYIRLFAIFITVGIITSFSRIGNFLLLITVLFYMVNEFFLSKITNKSFKYTIILIFLFDIVILGFYFGSSQILDRFALLEEEFFEIVNINDSLNRFQIIKFGLSQFYDFKFFGYGVGSFKTLFQINFANLDSYYANHAHSDIVEYLGELGLIGFILLSLSMSKFFLNKHSYNFINLILFSYLLIILAFDFSLHMPIIQILFLMFFVLKKKLIS